MSQPMLDRLSTVCRSATEEVIRDVGCYGHIGDMQVSKADWTWR